ncbi:MAG TPA: 3-deoxy-manno-octulosonate-8-phosphatase KdsC [Gammaproteobacteria bacterium]|jgi:3-deoxy-D-manno-octulosonate 8-phosphate phosphatase (KDO 8-P phosphatase)
MTAENGARARQVKLLIVDVDGVLTDGGLYFDNRGEELKRFCSLDGHGMRMALGGGIEIAVITGRRSNIVEHRMRDLGVSHVYQGSRDKLPVFEQLLRDTGLEAEQAAYVGDDLPDLPIMHRVGFAIAVQNAHGFVKQHCDWVTSARGGDGAVREVTDFILHSQGLLDAQQQGYLT